MRGSSLHIGVRGRIVSESIMDLMSEDLEYLVALGEKVRKGH